MAVSPPPPPKKPKQFEAEIRGILAAPLEDAELRSALETMAAEPLFGGSTALWGPVLHRRNRILFRPFILAHFATWRTDGRRLWEQVPWQGEFAPELDAWLAEVDRLDDVELFRRLYAWKHTTRRGVWLDESTWRQDLLARYRAAATRHERNTVLAKLDLGATLDEATALELDALDPDGSRAFILRHLTRSRFWDQAKRRLWVELFERARRRGDDDLAFALYRQQVPLKDWGHEVVRLCTEVNDAGRLVGELERRHPEGWGLDLGDALYEAVRRRGRDVFPYVLRHLRDVWGRGWLLRGSFENMLALAEREGWLDLWSGLLRVAARDEEFDREVARLVHDEALGADEVRRRLSLLAGVSREWSAPGLGLAHVHPLKDQTAVVLHERFPDLVRGPFRRHVAPTWGEPYAGLIDWALAMRDEDLVDFLASRLVTRPEWSGGVSQKFVAAAETLSVHYERLRAADPREFSRRAAAVLGQVPAYSIASYDRLIRTNRLARLFYERSSASFLDDPPALRDLLEAPEIHAQALALRALGLDDDRARALAAANLDLLQATLLRPLHRRTRLLAFAALGNASTTAEAARRVLDRARQALDLPDRRYPKEALIGLIGRLLHAHPRLRGPLERPVVFGEAVA